MNKLKYILAFALSLLIAGCIASGTIIIIFDVDEFVASETDMQMRHIDLTQEADYNDNKDRIRSIDQVEVVGWFFNELSTENQAVIYVSQDSTLSTPAEVESEATRVFVSPSIPGNDTLFVNWSDGLSYIENLATLKTYADAGDFYIYGLAADSPFQVRFRLSLIITITAGL